ncbi:MAG: NUDIX hydrolase [Candidatus Hydrogenedentota bacterium]|nr:MAG: NUDIX hydrolase [Candidatus Hydrogenedentota bacterium]
MSDAAPLRDAATIVLCRDSGSNLETFMVVRHHQIDFASGAAVFPGGKLEAADREPRILDRCCTTSSENIDLLPFKAAAIREAYEESGILIAREGDSAQWVSADRLATFEPSRVAMNAGKLEWAVFLEQENLTLACDHLHHFAHWITPAMMPKRFDTHFFIASAPEDHLGMHDGSEAVDSVWIHPQQLLDEEQEGKWTVIFPTRLNVMLLTQSPSYDNLRDITNTRSVVTVEPWFEQEDEDTFLCIPPEAGYPVSREKVTGQFPS